MSMFHRVLTRYHRLLFGIQSRAVRTTPPVCADANSSFVIVSQCYHRDVDMFLVAAKSFSSYFRPKRFVIVDDGLGKECRAHLSYHLGDVTYIPRLEVRNEFCPRGGCWERLLTIADHCQDSYVVQLDSDTVTCAKPQAVIDAVSRNLPFTLSTMDGREIVTALEASALADSVSGLHVQLVAERALKFLPNAEDLLYIRGCAGFSGFARNTINRSMVESLSARMAQLVGMEMWKQWGSEQFASNFLVANSLGAIPLPFPKYPYWGKSIDISEAEFIHFIGTDRFTGPQYRLQALKAIRRLSGLH